MWVGTLGTVEASTVPASYLFVYLSTEVLVEDLTNII